jgi:UDP-2,4-diacetamido-2,4,6-trideoxy-beta-L-altropyranose hydrolase
MKIVFRTDSSLQIGTGHVMRCLTLAEALRVSGAECLFICREQEGCSFEQIRQRGFDLYSLPPAIEFVKSPASVTNQELSYSAWLGTDWATDAAQTKTVIDGIGADWLIIDHYAIDARWERVLRSMCRKLMVIDDLADRPHECDLLLDQNLGRITSDYSSLVPSDCIVLAGPRFALLRPEFAEFRDYSLRHRTTSKIDSLLITMGGIDKGDATGKILEALKDCSLPKDCEITVIMGQHAPSLSRVNLLSTEMPWPTKVKVNVDNVAELMANSNLAIGAGGSTSWERCCLGLPTIIVILAENQMKVADALAKNGCAIVLGPPDAISKNLRSLLHMLTIDNKLHQMTQSSRTITDGQGVDRIKHILLENHV